MKGYDGQRAEQPAGKSLAAELATVKAQYLMMGLVGGGISSW